MSYIFIKRIKNTFLIIDRPVDNDFFMLVLSVNYFGTSSTEFISRLEIDGQRDRSHLVQ